MTHLLPVQDRWRARLRSSSLQKTMFGTKIHFVVYFSHEIDHQNKEILGQCSGVQKICKKHQQDLMRRLKFPRGNDDSDFGGNAYLVFSSKAQHCPDVLATASEEPREERHVERTLVITHGLEQATADEKRNYLGHHARQKLRKDSGASKILVVSKSDCSAFLNSIYEIAKDSRLKIIKAFKLTMDKLEGSKAPPALTNLRRNRGLLDVCRQVTLCATGKVVGNMDRDKDLISPYYEDQQEAMDYHYLTIKITNIAAEIPKRKSKIASILIK